MTIHKDLSPSSHGVEGDEDWHDEGDDGKEEKRGRHLSFFPFPSSPRAPLEHFPR